VKTRIIKMAFKRGSNFLISNYITHHSLQSTYFTLLVSEFARNRNKIISNNVFVTVLNKTTSYIYYAKI